MNYEVIAFGELLWDCLPTGRVIGGAPANFAYRLNQLGVKTALVTRVGADPLGTELIQILTKKEIPTELIQRDEELPTGTVDVWLSPAGDASYTIHPHVAYDALELTPEMVTAARGAKAICFGTLIQRSEKSRATLYSLLDRARQAVKIVDINLRRDCFTAETVRASLERADILKLNEQEVTEVAKLVGLPSRTNREFSLGAIHDFSLLAVIVTRGANGVEGYDSQGEEVDISGHSVDVVDTVGSGDNFTAGFVYQFLRGASLAECAGMANRLGALTATKQGGMPTFTVAELRSLGI